MMYMNKQFEIPHFTNNCTKNTWIFVVPKNKIWKEALDLSESLVMQ